MANYRKRDARKAWVADMAAHRGDRLTSRPLPVCHCGEVAVFEVVLSDGARYFCAKHLDEGEAMFRDTGR